MRHRKNFRILYVILIVLLCITGCSKNSDSKTKDANKDKEPQPTYYNLDLTINFENNLIFDKYDVYIYIGDKKVGDISQGDTFKDKIDLEEGMYELYFYKADDQDVSGHSSINMNDDRVYSCSIKSHKEEIEIKDEQNETLTEINERKAVEEEKAKEEAERKAAEEEQQKLQAQLEDDLTNCIRSQVDVGQETAEESQYTVSLINLHDNDITDKYNDMEDTKKEKYLITEIKNIDHDNKTVEFVIATNKKMNSLEKKKYKGLNGDPLSHAFNIAEEGEYTVSVKDRKGNRVDNKTDFDRTKYAFLSVDKVNYSKAKIVFNADTKKHLAALKAKKEKKSDDSSYDRVPRRGNGELTKEQFLNEEVIITPSGSCYHVDGCNTLRGSVSWIKRKDARNRGYSPCAKCHPDFGHAGW